MARGGGGVRDGVFCRRRLRKGKRGKQCPSSRLNVSFLDAAAVQSWYLWRGVGTSYPPPPGRPLSAFPSYVYAAGPVLRVCRACVSSTRKLSYLPSVAMFLLSRLVLASRGRWKPDRAWDKNIWAPPPPMGKKSWLNESYSARFFRILEIERKIARQIMKNRSHFLELFGPLCRIRVRDKLSPSSPAYWREPLKNLGNNLLRATSSRLIVTTIFYMTIIFSNRGGYSCYLSCLYWKHFSKTNGWLYSYVPVNYSGLGTWYVYWKCVYDML